MPFLVIIMTVKTKKSPILPSLERHLARMGENIRLARQRRELTAEIIAERAGISRHTLMAIEKGSDRVAMGSYAKVLLSLGLEKELNKIGADDEFGYKLQDARLGRKK
jgi:transcriptional regulator with XRE-family HTH domain